MNCKPLRLLLPFLLLSIFFQSNAFAIRIDAKLPDQSNRNLEPGTPLTITPCISGMAGPYPCNKIDLLAFVPIASMGCTGSGNVVEGWVDPTTNKEYGLMGCNNGVSFVDVTDPVNPIWIGRLPGHNNSTSLWRDIRVYSSGANHRMYVGSEAGGHGIQVFDLTRLRTATPPQTFTEDAHYAGLGNSHTIFLNQSTGFLYAVGSGGGSNPCTSGLHMINVQNLVPSFAGCFGNGIYTHEVTCVTYNGPDTTYVGKEICFGANGPTEQLVISDVTNKNTPVQLSATGYSGSGYPHQVWLTEDHTYLLLNDEFDESTFGVDTTTYIWNISDLNAPVLIDNYVHPTTSIDHNLYVKDNYVYESNYQSGLRILDLTDVASGTLSESAFFDIWPYGEAPDFEGTWDNYPYLPSGIVLVSGIFNPPVPNPANVAGLFILQPNLAPDFLLSADDSILNACGTGSAGTTIDITPRSGYSGNVTLSALNLPAGASAGFSPNPVGVPGSSSLTLTLSGTPAGNYPFDVQGTDGTLTHSTPLTLNVATSILSAPTLLNPPNNTTDETFVVHYEWNPVPGASSYDLEVAADSNFTNIIYSVNETEDHHTGVLTLDPLTQYWWRTRTINACGASSWSTVFTFTTAAPANILLVDDDNNAPDVLSYYQDALNFAGETFDVWDTSIQAIQNGPNSPSHLDEPDAATMSNYQMVIWFSGDAAGGAVDPKAGPTESSETSLTQYLNSGGCFFLSSEEYFADRGSVLSPFMANQLGIQSMNNNVSMTNVTGNGIFNGVGNFTLQFPANLSNLTDRVVPNVTLGAQVAFSGNQGNAAISRDSGTYRTIFLGFPFEAIPTQSKRREVMQKAIDYCLNTTCPAITLTPTSLPAGTQGTPYNQTIVATGGTAPYTYAVSSGSLPAGLSLTNAGVLSGTPTGTGTSNFTVLATDSDGCTGTRLYSLTINSGTCTFCDDFEDGVLNPNWTYMKQTWNETGGNLVGTPNGKKVTAIATPVFSGCMNCSAQTQMRTAGGIGSRISLFAWFVDRRNTLELQMNQEKGRFILKQKVNGTTVAKQKSVQPINTNQFYDVRVTFTGTQFEVRVDGVLVITMNSGGAVPAGTVGFQVKNTTGSFGSIVVN
ncbi:MAG TPA: choice-of-anchor B family protein [Acidobacteriota bacterium]|nr:choice-of-anchor B family protein [Acidobacteriota bacterium]